MSRAAIIFTGALLLAAGTAGAATRTWTGLGADNLASTPANWSDNTRPASTDHILLNATTNKNMTWDAPTGGLPDTVASWKQSEDYTGTVTFRTLYGASGFTNFTVSGDAEVRGGVWTHADNTTADANRLRVTVGGNLLVTNATIRADVLGRNGGSPASGPGAAPGVWIGGAHGGSGGGANTKTYGSVTAPTQLGSGGESHGAPWGKGGGAIWLTVAGTTTVASAGVVTANGENGAHGAGSGGSVLLETGWLTGGGTIRANGGTAGGGAGGGGRVAVLLTGADADFTNWTGANQALGGATASAGAAGTVYRRTADGVDELIIDNNNVGASGQTSTLMPPAPNAVNLNAFTNVVIRNKGILGIRDVTTVDFGTFAPTVYGAANSYVTIHSDAGVTYPTDWTIAGYTLIVNTIAAGKLVNVTVATDGSVSHFTGPANALNLALSGNLTVNGTISADSLGNGNRAGPGAVSQVTYGAAHGGWAGSGNRALTPGVWYNNKSYGSILAPTQPGSGGASDGTPHGVGGGAIALTVAGTTTVAAATGFISANGANGLHGGGSGGSIRLTTGRLEGAGTIRANGGTGFYGAGAGGRIAIILTGNDQDFSSWSGANTAYGGASAYPAAAGTVYRQAKADLAGAGTVLVNNNNVSTNVTLTPIPAFVTSTENIGRSAWVTTDRVRLGLVTNTSIGSLTLNTNGHLDLRGYTGTVSSLTITNATFPAGIYAATDLGAMVSDSGGGAGRIVVYPAGLYLDDTSVLEGPSGTTTNASFRLRLYNVSFEVTLDYYTTNGTATAGVDYTSAMGTLTVAAGIEQTNILVQVIGDDWIEADETFRLIITNVTGAAVIDGEAIGTIINDDARTISIASSVVVDPEGPLGVDTTAVFTVTLSEAIGTDVTFQYDTQDGTATTTGTVEEGTYDYVPVSGGTATIKAGTTQTNLVIVVKGDDVLEDNETFFVVLSNPSANATLGTATGTCTIVDDDGLPKLSVADVTVIEGNTGTTNANFVVSINKTDALPVTFDYQTVDGTATAASGDYIAVSGSGSIPAGELQTTVTVVVAGDYLPEADETFELRLYNISANAEGFRTNAVGTILNDDYPFVWTGEGGSGLASATNNWRWNGATATRLPAATDVVQLDGASSSNLTWDAGVNGLTNTVASWDQRTGYTGTVTFRTVYGATGFTNFTVSGNAEVRGGVWTHTVNTTADANRLRVTVGGNLLVTNATIRADGLGRNDRSGPGAGTSVWMGGAHGGSGGGNANTYGSVTAPTQLGSGGASDGAPFGKGGGAIWLTVAGTTTVAFAGVVTANGGNGLHGAGSGGSVFLETGWIAGGGTIRANGGYRHNTTSYSGGGGRVAVVLTGAAADFGAWTGTNATYGAAAGTVYRRTAAGIDELIIDNNNVGAGSTLMPPAPNAVDLNVFSNVVIRNRGMLGIRDVTTVDFGTFAPTVYGAANSYVTIHSDAGVTYPPDWTIADYTLTVNTIGPGKLVNVTVATNGIVRHFSGPTHAMNLTLSGNLTVNGTISADSLGHGNRAGPGGVATTTHGAAHGGWARGDGRTHNGFVYNNNTYGSILAPTQPGSGGASDGTPHGVGGGAIALTVAGTTTVAAATGFISANGANGLHGGGSGGSIRLTTGRLEGAGTIRANGGTGGMGAGAGGRIAIILTGAGHDFSTWSGANTAYGGASSQAAAAGTVYLQTQAQAAKQAGTVLADNASRAINVTRTPLPTFGTSTENISNTVWIVDNNTRLGLVADAAVASLELEGANSRLELSGRTLNVGALTVAGTKYPNGTYTASDIASHFTDEGTGGQVVVYKPPKGTLFLMR